MYQGAPRSSTYEKCEVPRIVWYSSQSGAKSRLVLFACPKSPFGRGAKSHLVLFASATSPFGGGAKYERIHHLKFSRESETICEGTSRYYGGDESRSCPHSVQTINGLEVWKY